MSAPWPVLATDPPALFGCEDGIDGKSIGAYGDFGSSALLEVAVGAFKEFSSFCKAEYELIGRHRNYIGYTVA